MVHIQQLFENILLCMKKVNLVLILKLVTITFSTWFCVLTMDEAWRNATNEAQEHDNLHIQRLESTKRLAEISKKEEDTKVKVARTLVHHICKTGQLKETFCESINTLTLGKAIKVLQHFPEYEADYRHQEPHALTLAESYVKGEAIDTIRLTTEKLENCTFTYWQHICILMAYGFVIVIQILTLKFSSKVLNTILFGIVFIISCDFSYEVDQEEIYDEVSSDRKPDALVFIWLFGLIMMVESYAKSQKKKSLQDIQSVSHSMLFLLCSRGNKADQEELRASISNFSSENGINDIKNGNTIFHIAVRNCNLDIMKILCAQQNIDLTLRNSDGNNVFDMAVVNNDLTMLEYLLGQAQPDHSAIINAIEKRNIKMIELLRSKLPSKVLAKVMDPLDRFCDGVKELEKKNLYNRRNIQTEVNNCKTTIIRILKSEPKGFSDTEVANQRRSYNCTVCWEEILPPREIFACSQDHLICNTCLCNVKDSSKNSCPSCRESFDKNPPRRRKDYELWNSNNRSAGN